MIDTDQTLPADRPAANGAGAVNTRRRWPVWLRRGRAELAACVLIATGLGMLLQPFSMWLYTWSFVTMLLGTVSFMIVSKFPE